MWGLLIFLFIFMAIFGLIALSTFQRFAYFMEDVSTVASIADRNL